MRKVKEVLTSFGYEIKAMDLRGDTVSGCYEDRIDRKTIIDVDGADYLSAAKEMVTPEQAYRTGRNSALAALGTVIMVSAVAVAYAENAGHIDIIPDGTRADFSMEQGPSIPAEVPAQAAPTDMPSIVHFN